ncbi:hypothetical protein LZ32DRAFT_86286 [Colletotrichum eremochloae]|nr:hypothetical protein LZ32DRAFT_86286 [Colletotrichum eremochloae]
MMPSFLCAHALQARPLRLSLGTRSYHTFCIRPSTHAHHSLSRRATEKRRDRWGGGRERTSPARPKKTRGLEGPLFFFFFFPSGTRSDRQQPVREEKNQIRPIPVSRLAF